MDDKSTQNSEESALLQELVAAEADKRPAVEASPVASFGRGLARGAIGPLLDIYYGATGQGKAVRRQDEMSPIAEGVGQLTGLVGGGLLSGGTGALATAGKFTVGGAMSAAGAATRAAGAAKLGAAANTLGGRLALSAAAGGVEGGLAGLAEGSSAAALDRESGLPGTARHAMEGVGYGMALGGGLSVLGTAFYRTNNWLFKKAYGDQIKKAAKAQSNKMDAHRHLSALDEEIKNLEQTIPPEARGMYPTLGSSADRRLQEVLGSFGSTRTVDRGKHVGEQMFYKGRPLGRNLDDGTVPEILLAQRRLDAADKTLSALTTGGAARMGKEAREIARTLILTAPSLFAGGPMGAMGTLIFRKFMPEYVVGIADKLIDGIERFPMVRQAIGRSIQGGELTLDKFHKFGDEIVRIPAGMRRNLDTGILERTPLELKNIDSYVFGLRNAAKSLKVAPLHHMTTDEYNDIVQEFNNTDIGEYEMQSRMALAAAGIPQESINGHIEHQLRVQQYIKSTLPPAKGDRWITETGDRLVATDAERFGLARRMRAAMIPETVPHDFMNDRLTPEAAEAWWATSPDAAAALSAEVTSLVELSRAYGIKLPSRTMRQVALVTNNPTKSGRQFDPAMIALLQSNYQTKQPDTPQAQPGGPGYKPVKLNGVSDAAMSGAQQLAQRMAGSQ